MAFRMGIGLLVPLVLVLDNWQEAATPQVKPERRAAGVIAREGEFVSPKGGCRAVLKRSPLGGFLVLRLEPGPTRAINDVTGIAWASGETLVYTVSPIYGDEPGVYSHNCHSHRAKRLVGPTERGAAHAKEYFQLQGVSESRPVTIYFYYTPDVDKEDFANFESPAHLYQVRPDGTGFQKAAQPPAQ